MDYLNETYKSVAIMDMETLHNFAENLRFKDHLYSLDKIPNSKKGLVPKPNQVLPKWVWRREKVPMAYRSLEWGNVMQTLKSNYWGRKIALFYDKMKVFYHITTA